MIKEDKYTTTEGGYTITIWALGTSMTGGTQIGESYTIHCVG